MPVRPLGKSTRKEELILAAVRVLKAEGIVGCTARSIAAASDVTKSALHYHFDDVDQVIDLAMDQLMVDFIDRIEKSAERASDPVEALWCAAETYLVLGGRHKGRIPLLWFEYHMDAVRRGRTASVAKHTENGIAVWLRLMEATGTPNPREKSRAFDAVLIGSIAHDSLFPRPVGAVLHDVAVSLELPRPQLPTEILVWPPVPG